MPYGAEIIAPDLLDTINGVRKALRKQGLLGFAMEIQIKSEAHVNSLFWIKSLNPGEEGWTRRILDDLEPFLNKIGVPFVLLEPRTAADCLEAFDAIARLAREGARPIVHIDTHGNPREGLFVAESKEFIGWDVVSDKLRDINVATQNNLCVVSAVCFGFYPIKHVSILKPVSAYLLIGPTDTVSFHFFEVETVKFYKKVFEDEDIFGAYEKHLKSQLSVFHCEVVCAVVFARYFRENCMGKGKKERLERLITDAVNLGASRNRETLRYMRKEAKKAIKPSEKTYLKYAIPFLVGRKPSATYKQVMALAKNEEKANELVSSS